jgi:hypothetical protein
MNAAGFPHYLAHDERSCPPFIFLYLTRRDKHDGNAPDCQAAA